MANFLPNGQKKKGKLSSGKAQAVEGVERCRWLCVDGRGDRVVKKVYRLGCGCGGGCGGGWVAVDTSREQKQVDPSL